MILSTVVPQVQAIFPEGSLTKTIKVSVQAQQVSPETVMRLHGNRVAVSPIVTVEPRRRKFHKPITLCIPLPQSAHKGMLTQFSGQPGQEPPTLRLLCSITAGASAAIWEDITGTTQLTFAGDVVSFTTTVSARFWLMDCQTPRDAARMAHEVYNDATSIPYMAKFVIFARRTHPTEGQLRVFCMTDDKEEKTLEKQEHFTEIAKSRDVEVLSGRHQFLEFAGSLMPVTKSGDQICLYFLPFQENRLAFLMKVRDSDDQQAATSGRVAFMRDPKLRTSDLLPGPQHPVATLAVTLPDYTGRPSPVSSQNGHLDGHAETLEQRYPTLAEVQTVSSETALPGRAYRLSAVAKEVGGDWQRLARALDTPDQDMRQIRHEYPGREAAIVLRVWRIRRAADHQPDKGADALEAALRRIGREDIVRRLNAAATESFGTVVFKAITPAAAPQTTTSTTHAPQAPHQDAQLESISEQHSSLAEDTSDTTEPNESYRATTTTTVQQHTTPETDAGGGYSETLTTTTTTTRHTERSGGDDVDYAKDQPSPISELTEEDVSSGAREEAVWGHSGGDGGVHRPGEHDNTTGGDVDHQEQHSTSYTRELGADGGPSNSKKKKKRKGKASAVVPSTEPEEALPTIIPPPDIIQTVMKVEPDVELTSQSALHEAIVPLPEKTVSESVPLSDSAPSPVLESETGFEAHVSPVSQTEPLSGAAIVPISDTVSVPVSDELPIEIAPQESDMVPSFVSEVLEASAIEFVSPHMSAPDQTQFSPVPEATVPDTHVEEQAERQAPMMENESDHLPLDCAPPAVFVSDEHHHAIELSEWQPTTADVTPELPEFDEHHRIIETFEEGESDHPSTEDGISAKPDEQYQHMTELSEAPVEANHQTKMVDLIETDSPLTEGDIASMLLTSEGHHRTIESSEEPPEPHQPPSPVPTALVLSTTQEVPVCSPDVALDVLESPLPNERADEQEVEPPLEAAECLLEEDVRPLEDTLPSGGGMGFEVNAAAPLQVQETHDGAGHTTTTITHETEDGGLLTRQQKESTEEGWTDEQGNKVVSKKMTRIVTTTRSAHGNGEEIDMTQTGAALQPINSPQEKAAQAISSPVARLVIRIEPAPNDDVSRISSERPLTAAADELSTMPSERFVASQVLQSPEEQETVTTAPSSEVSGTLLPLPSATQLASAAATPTTESTDQTSTGSDENRLEAGEIKFQLGSPASEQPYETEPDIEQGQASPLEDAGDFNVTDAGSLALLLQPSVAHEQQLAPLDEEQSDGGQFISETVQQHEGPGPATDALRVVATTPRPSVAAVTVQPDECLPVAAAVPGELPTLEHAMAVASTTGSDMGRQAGQAEHISTTMDDSRRVKAGGSQASQAEQYGGEFGDVLGSLESSMDADNIILPPNVQYRSRVIKARLVAKQDRQLSDEADEKAQTGDRTDVVDSGMTHTVDKSSLGLKEHDASKSSGDKDHPGMQHSTPQTVHSVSESDAAFVSSHSLDKVSVASEESVKGGKQCSISRQSSTTSKKSSHEESPTFTERLTPDLKVAYSPVQPKSPPSETTKPKAFDETEEQKNMDDTPAHERLSVAGGENIKVEPDNNADFLLQLQHHSNHPQIEDDPISDVGATGESKLCPVQEVSEEGSCASSEENGSFAHTMRMLAAQSKHAAEAVSNDNMSESSIQEFERLERETALRGDASLSNSEAELVARPTKRCTSEGSQGSLNEFEKLEHELEQTSNLSNSPPTPGRGAALESLPSSGPGDAVMMLSDIWEENEPLDDKGTSGLGGQRHMSGHSAMGRDIGACLGGGSLPPQSKTDQTGAGKQPAGMPYDAVGPIGLDHFAQTMAADCMTGSTSYMETSTDSAGSRTQSSQQPSDCLYDNTMDDQNNASIHDQNNASIPISLRGPQPGEHESSYRDQSTIHHQQPGRPALSVSGPEPVETGGLMEGSFYLSTEPSSMSASQMTASSGGYSYSSDDVGHDTQPESNR